MKTREKSYTDYGITDDEKKQIFDFCRNAESDKHDKLIVKSALNEMPPYIAGVIYKALTTGLSYERLDEKDSILICKEDFYGYRRKGMEAVKRYMLLVGRWVS